MILSVQSSFSTVDAYCQNECPVRRRDAALMSDDERARILHAVLSDVQRALDNPFAEEFIEGSQHGIESIENRIAALGRELVHHRQTLAILTDVLQQRKAP